MAGTRSTKKTSGPTANKRKPAKGSPASGKSQRGTSGKRAAKSTSSAGKGSARGPLLLSGGNPQIAKGDGDAPVQAYIDAMPGWKREVGRELDALIMRIVPQARKAVRWNSPFYGIEGQGWFLSYHCFARYIKLTFLRGSALRPLPPVASKDRNTRYYHIQEDEPFDDKLMASWLEQAARIPGDPLF